MIHLNKFAIFVKIEIYWIRNYAIKISVIMILIKRYSLNYKINTTIEYYNIRIINDYISFLLLILWLFLCRFFFSIFFSLFLS